MYRISMLVAALALLACTPEPLTRAESPCRGLDLQVLESEAYTPAVTAWDTSRCRATEFRVDDYDRNAETSDDVYMLIGFRGGYSAPCLFQSVPVDLTGLRPGAELCVVVDQRGGPSLVTDVQFYTHLFTNFDGEYLDTAQPQYMPYYVGEDSGNYRPVDYEAGYLFPVPDGARELRLTLGVDPQYVSGVHPEEQPSVWIKSAGIYEVIR